MQGLIRDSAVSIPEPQLQTVAPSDILPRKTDRKVSRDNSEDAMDLDPDPEPMNGLPQDEGESGSPAVVEARPTRIIKIKSRAAVQHFRKLEKKVIGCEYQGLTEHA
jgi:hypothetical protein